MIYIQKRRTPEMVKNRANEIKRLIAIKGFI